MMLLKTVLVPLSAILAVVSALPTGADAALQHAEAELEARGDLPPTAAPGGYEDEGEVVDISSWVPSNVPSGVSPRSNPLFGRQLNPPHIACGTGKVGDSIQFQEWFREAGTREICMRAGEVKTWVHGRNRFKVSNGTGGLRCNKLKTFGENAYQLSSTGAFRCQGRSCMGPDHIYSRQMFSLYSV